MTLPKQLPTTQWKFKESVNKDIENSLSKEFGIYPIISQILANREILDMEGARR